MSATIRRDHHEQRQIVLVTADDEDGPLRATFVPEADTIFVWLRCEDNLGNAAVIRISTIESAILVRDLLNKKIAAHAEREAVPA